MCLLKRALLVIVLVSCHYYSWSQCGSGGMPAVPTNSWVGYVYNGVNTFTNGNYQGAITEPQNFDQTWDDNVNFSTTNGCNVQTETFTIRFKMNQAFTCGFYTFTVGADDGIRLSLDNGTSYIIDQFHDQSYTTYSTTVFLRAGTYNLVLDYYENASQNRVSYSYASAGAVTTSSGGTIAADQSSCTGGFDPAAFTSVTPAGYCGSSAAITYRWEKSTTSSTAGFAAIAATNSLVYDEPGPVNATTWYRRRATNNGTTFIYSNVLAVTIDPPGSNQTLAGTNSWIGHVYDGRDNYTSTDYQGSYTEPAIFDESFCGDNCTFAINGCDFNTETFSVRYRMSFTVSVATDYVFTVGGDDGYRFSINGTSIVDNYVDHGYTTTTSATVTLTPATYNFVLDFFENGGGNRITFDYTGVLPVTWSYFDGYFLNGENVIEWRTAVEENNSGFVVERSTDAKTFDSLAFVDGHGTADVANRYEFHDANPYPGWNYYRLKQIDHDRKFEYSRLIPIYSEITGATAIYPNPASDELYISHVRPEQNIGVAIRGVMNGKFYTLTNDPKQPSKFSLKNVAPGMYLITITVDDTVHSEKLIVY